MRTPVGGRQGAGIGQIIAIRRIGPFGVRAGPIGMVKRQESRSALPKEEIAAEVERHKPKPALESALDRLRHVGPKVLNLLIPDDIIGAASQLRRSSSYALVTAAAVADVLRPLCEPGAAFEFTSRLAANPRLRQAIGDWVAALGEDFGRVKGPRNFDTLRSMLAARPVFNAEFLSIFAESAEGCGLPEGLLSGVEETLLALKPNEAMSDGLITAVTAASTANLAGRFATALQRDPLFKGAFSASAD